MPSRCSGAPPYSKNRNRGSVATCIGRAQRDVAPPGLGVVTIVTIRPAVNNQYVETASNRDYHHANSVQQRNAGLLNVSVSLNNKPLHVNNYISVRIYP